MKEFIINNFGKIISAVAIIFSICGFLIGVYVTQKTLGEDIEHLTERVDEHYDLLKNWIQRPKPVINETIPSQ